MSLKSIFNSVSSLLTPLISEQPSTELKEVTEAKAEYTVPGTNVRLLDTAVLLVPCAHQMPEESAKSQFGPMNGQYCEQKGLECPHCEQKVTGYLTDHKMRTLSQKIPQILEVEPKNQAQMEEVKERLRGELICPIELEPLSEGVALLPCAHRVNRATAETMYGVMQGEFCTKQLQPCAECRKIVSGYIVDPSIRELSIALPQRLVEMERELMPISERFKESFQSFGLGLQTAAQAMRTSLADGVETIRQRSAEWGVPRIEIEINLRRIFQALNRIPRSFTLLSESEMSSIDLMNKARALVGQIAIHSTNINTRIGVLEGEKAVEAALDDFFSTFKAHCQRLGISATDPRFPICAQAAGHLLLQISREVTTEYPLTFNQQLQKTIREKFNRKIFKGIVKDFARKRIAGITIEGFKKTVQALTNIFGDNSNDAIAFELRRAIFKMHARNLSDFSISLLAAAVDVHSNLFRESRWAYERTLKEIETQLEAERLALGGRDWGHRSEGLLVQTYVAKIRAMDAVEIAEREVMAAGEELGRQPEVSFIDARRGIINYFHGLSFEDDRRFDASPPMQIYNDKYRAYREAKGVFEAAEGVFNELKYRFIEIASRLSHVREQLAHLDDMVKTDMTRNAELLSELAIDPSTMQFNASARARALQRIVGY